MKKPIVLLTASLLVSLSTTATTLYVDVNNVAPAYPYTNWVTAATNIQDAVDASVDGDQVLVNDGVYAAGATAVYGMSNRVAMTKAVTVQSVNGPGATAILGNGPNGPAAVRCAYLTNGAVLAGFTLTNGATQTTGDSGKQESGGGVWCESRTAVVSNSVFVGNSAFNSGGGAYCGTLNNCSLSGNSASTGGGTYSGTLSNCTLIANQGSIGGGAGYGALNNCTLTSNHAGNGGGAYQCTLTNCTLNGNSVQGAEGGAGGEGGGAFNSTLKNCAVIGNVAYLYTYTAGNGGGWGGGAFVSTLYNCTLTGNFGAPAGADRCSLVNCILHYNYTPDGQTVANYDSSLGSSSLAHCCTTPLPAGLSNFTTEPQLASAYHLSAGSPCRAAGWAIFASGLDIDGEPWASPPSVGCDEYWSGSVTGMLTAAIVVVSTNVPMGFSLQLQAAIAGRVSTSYWDFGDGAMLTNRPYASHAWAIPGDYTVTLRAYNDSYPGGVATNVIMHVIREHYVALTNSSPTWPYGMWATAATNIQDAVDAAGSGATIWVGDGVYQSGASAGTGASNRVAVTKPLLIQSVNGPGVTIISGNGPLSAMMRCVYLTNGAVLAGFTLTNGGAQGYGGGVCCQSFSAVVSNCVLTGGFAYYGGGASSGTLNNCVLSGNLASYYGGGACGSTLNNCTLMGNYGSGYGGGAWSGTLNNCALTGNSAYYGGGAYSSTLNNCTLTANTATNSGGGAYSDTLNNCIVYYNAAPNGNYSGSTFRYSCTTPLPSGPGNFTNEPLFVNQAGGDLHLQANSPCINSGLNAYAPAGTDLDGNPRISGGTVDVGAHEFQSPTSVISYAWLQQYGLPTDGSVDYLDTDHDGRNNWQEWIAGTDPTNAGSVLLLGPPVVGTGGVTLTWASSAYRTYYLERATNVSGPPLFSTLQTNVSGLAGTTSCTDTNPPATGAASYRVGVQR